MANLVFDFLHHYQTGERRASDPADAYQYDEGHVMEAIVPVEVTSCEIHYWVRGMEEAQAYTPDSITQNTDGSYSITGHIPNTYFETYGDLRVYIVVTDGSASITTYEGRIHICERAMPDDYVDDDPDNEAVQIIAAARGYAETSEAWAVGQINGEDVPSTADQYQNNASYYAGQAASAASSAAAQASLAPAYDNTATYEVGDYCLHSGQLYECTTAITTAEAWDSTHWTAVTVGEELTDLKTESTALKEDYTTILDSAYVTDTASGAIASFPDGADGVPIKSLTVDIEPVQSGSGDPSPTNIRPITGHTSAVVTRTGANVWDEVWELGAVLNSNGQNADSYTDRIRSKNYIPVMPNTQYYVYGGTQAVMYKRFYDATKTYIGSAYSLDTSMNSAFTTPANAYYMRFNLAPAYGTTYKTDISVNYPATVHEYNAYNGQTVTIDLNGTRYGGTLNLDTGTLTDNPRWFATVDRQIVDLGTLNWTYSERYFYATTPYPVPVYNAYSAYANAICSAYRVEKFGTMYNNYSTVDKCFSINNGSPNDNVVRLRDTAYADATSFKTAMNGVQLVYELATPFTVQLTANDDITTVLGQNNIWADTGDTEVTYRADTKFYIQKVMSS